MYMENYTSLISEAFESGKPVVLNNSDLVHARVLIRELLRRATCEVKILCHRLAREVYGNEEVCRALEDAYRDHPKLNCKVYIRNSEPDFSSFLSILLSHRVQINTGVDIESQQGDVIIVDARNGREEIDCKKRTALAHINDTEWATEMEHKLSRIESRFA